ncbi:hypothetical protein H8S10_08360 [Clostridium sp. NSJ-49]|uniref:Uncharacterized protein n=2 Tax=Clostridium disporicum TaxID=84024 RepID=A0A174GBU6_9CLOT|nr:MULTISPECIES: hypothetical protein [Clostridium]MBC5625461.1 hypothetical protein [Clostridium sp. NSJ-49]MCD2500215.1 hypothetical protein [Clostridium sp. NSJ-145]MDU6340384.1 hypothetical protein [Clostridium sp.]CUO58370.1 Uncharacterised protein [Clostridium disporicum]
MKYQKYKDFLPENIRVKKVSEFERSNKRALFLMIFLNSILLPLNLNKINYDKDIEVFSEDDIYYYENKIKSIKEWININDDYYINISIQNNDGEIYLKDRKFAYNIEEEGFDIKEYKRIEDNMILRVIKR